MPTIPGEGAVGFKMYGFSGPAMVAAQVKIVNIVYLIKIIKYLGVSNTDLYCFFFLCVCIHMTCMYVASVVDVTKVQWITPSCVQVCVCASVLGDVVNSNPP